jgi:TetR/AcrR family transcriptional regulator, transcriptional repressor for nem operon
MLGLFASEMSHEYPPYAGRTSISVRLLARGCGTDLREAQAGDIDPRHDPGQLARFLINAWEGATVHLKINRDRGPLDDSFNISFKMLLK